MCMSSIYYHANKYEMVFSKVSEKLSSFKTNTEIKIYMMPNYHLESFMNGENILKPISKPRSTKMY